MVRSGSPASRAPQKGLPKQAMPTATGRLRPAGRLVRDLMTEKVFTLSPSDNLIALEDLMDARHVRHVPIVDREGDLVGLVTHRDLARNVLGRLDELPVSVERDLLRGRRIREIMTTEPETVEADATLKEAASVLFENKIGCQPVVEGMHLVGLMLPCNVIVYEGDDGRAVVVAVDPTETVPARGDSEVARVAETVRAKLERLLDRL
jgi:CBS domain-containing membrane protein